jgi:hypothetical protein
VAGLAEEVNAEEEVTGRDKKGERWGETEDGEGREGN